MAASGRTLGVLAAVLAALGFSAKAIFIKLSYPYGVDGVSLLCLRMLLAAPMFMVMAWHQGWLALPRRLWWELLFLGCIGYYLSSLFDFLGLQYINAALERVVLYLYPTLTVLMLALAQRRWPARAVTLALVVSYLGLLLVLWQEYQNFNPGPHWGQGVAWVFASACSYAWYLSRCKPMIQQLGSARFTAWVMLAATGFTLGHFSLTHPLQALIQPAPVYVWAGAMALFSTVLPSWLLAVAIGRLGADKVVLFSAFGPVLTLLLAVAVLHEPWHVLQVLGVALVLLGVHQAGRATQTKAA